MIGERFDWSSPVEGSQMLAGWQAAHERRLAEAMTGLSAADRRAIGMALPALSRLVDHLERSLVEESD